MQSVAINKEHKKLQLVGYLCDLHIKAHVSYCQFLLPVLRDTANFVPSIIRFESVQSRVLYL